MTNFTAEKLTKHDLSRVTKVNIKRAATLSGCALPGQDAVVSVGFVPQTQQPSSA